MSDNKQQHGLSQELPIVSDKGNIDFEFQIKNEVTFLLLLGF